MSGDRGAWKVKKELEDRRPAQRVKFLPLTPPRGALRRKKPWLLSRVPETWRAEENTPGLFKSALQSESTVHGLLLLQNQGLVESWGHVGAPFMAPLVVATRTQGAMNRAPPITHRLRGDA